LYSKDIFVWKPIVPEEFVEEKISKHLFQIEMAIFIASLD